MDTAPVADLPGAEEQQRRVDELERTVRNRTRQRDAAIKKRDEARSQLDHVLGSRSWQWTRPVREVVTVARRWRGR